MTPKTREYLAGFIDGVEDAPRPTVELVEEFHRAFGREIPQRPTLSTEDVRVMRVHLIAEELAELCQALRMDLRLTVECAYADDEKGDSVELAAWQNIDRYGQPDVVEAADALADLDYVVSGGFLDFGLPANELVADVHRSNMSKLDENGKPILRGDGKILKGPNYSPPDLRSIIERAGRLSD